MAPDGKSVCLGVTVASQQLSPVAMWSCAIGASSNEWQTRGLDDDERVPAVVDTLDGAQTVGVINESGLRLSERILFNADDKSKSICVFISIRTFPAET